MHSLAFFPSAVSPSLLWHVRLEVIHAWGDSKGLVKVSALHIELLRCPLFHIPDVVYRERGERFNSLVSERQLGNVWCGVEMRTSPAVGGVDGETGLLLQALKFVWIAFCHLSQLLF